MLTPILIHLRAMQLYSHHAHNLCARVPFHQDHEFFGEVYEALEGEYDNVIERQIGLHGEDGLDLNEILAGIHGITQHLETINVNENKTFYINLQSMEVKLLALIKSIIPSVSEGTRQMLGDICDRSEVRQYKISRRLK